MAEHSLRTAVPSGDSPVLINEHDGMVKDVLEGRLDMVTQERTAGFEIAFGHLVAGPSHAGGEGCARSGADRIAALVQHYNCGCHVLCTNDEPVSYRLRVMLADDHPALRQGLRALLDAQDDVAVVEEVGTVEATLSVLDAARPDVLVLDLSMPNAGALGAIPQIKAAQPKTAVVILTRYRDLAFVRQALKAGASGYVLKQSPFDELRRAMSVAVTGGQYVDSVLKAAFDDPPLESQGQATNRELDVLRRSALGQSNKEIASALSITVRTVEVHKTHGMKKLDLSDRSALIRYAALQGWLQEP